NGPLRFP
ncbi:hypothetical protein EE612_058991, partial [Oryza sativa]